MKDLRIRRFENKDAKDVSNIICRNFLEVNIKDYSEEKMKKLSEEFTEDKILARSEISHMYVATVRNEVVGCGAISSYFGKEDESILLNIFVKPEFQGKGVGKKIVEALEKDEFFLRARRIEIPSSITACEFYKKLGYSHKYNLKELDKEGYYRLEKFRYRLQYDQNYR